LKVISEHLGTGEVKNITVEEALLMKELDQNLINLLTVDIRMEPVAVKNFNFSWHSEVSCSFSVQKFRGN
jgi:hypothetical protein